MIKLTRVYAEGMQGHVSYRIYTSPLVIDPTAITAVSELKTSSYDKCINGVGPFHTVTKIQVGDQTYNVTESFDSVYATIQFAKGEV